jgi:hypothetical protein
LEIDMTVRQKIIVGAIAALFVLALMLVWGYFVNIGKTDTQAYIGQISVLISMAITVITVWCGHQAGAAAPQQGAAAVQVVSADSVAAAAPMPVSANVAPGAPGTQAVPAAATPPVGTLQ